MGRQFESLVVSVCGSLGLEQACHTQAWDRGWDGEGSTSLTPCGSSYYPSLWEGWAGLVGAGAVGIACRALPST